MTSYDNRCYTACQITENDINITNVHNVYYYHNADPMICNGWILNPLTQPAILALGSLGRAYSTIFLHTADFSNFDSKQFDTCLVGEGYTVYTISKVILVMPLSVSCLCSQWIQGKNPFFAPSNFIIH